MTTEATTAKREDLTGRRFGRLTVVAYSHWIKKVGAIWSCRCDCGTTKTVRGGNLLCGGTVSCGCYRNRRIGLANTTHGHSRRANGLHLTPTYHSWSSMLARSHTGADRRNAHNYIKRGITVCERWLRFEPFLADMGERPARTTLDRINNNRGYEPGNCRWATSKRQAYNKRTTLWLSAFSRTQTLDRWAAETGFLADTIYARLKRGWSDERAVSEPLHDVARPKNAK